MVAHAPKTLNSSEALSKALFLKDNFIYLFMPVMSLRCYAGLFPSFSKQRLLFIAYHGLLITVASLVAENGL